MPDTFDDFAFRAAHLAAPEIDPDRLRRAIAAYLADLHITVFRVTDGRALSPSETDAAFQPRDVEIEG